MSAPAIVAVVTLEQAIAVVEAELARAEAAVGAYAEDPSGWHARHRAAMASLADLLEARVGARINSRWDGCRVRIAGVVASSTSGLAGALANWLRAARAKAARARAGQ